MKSPRMGFRSTGIFTRLLYVLYAYWKTFFVSTPLNRTKKIMGLFIFLTTQNRQKHKCFLNLGGTVTSAESPRNTQQTNR
jgi:hypothetical protein